MAAALVACGRLHHQPAATLAQKVVDNPRQYAWQVRAAAAYVLGATGRPVGSDATGKLFALYSDSMEVAEVKLEALKALGHLKLPEAAAPLADIARTDTDVRLRWMAHWCIEQITSTKRAVRPTHINLDCKRLRRPGRRGRLHCGSRPRNRQLLPAVVMGAAATGIDQRNHCRD